MKHVITMTGCLVLQRDISMLACMKQINQLNLLNGVDLRTNVSAKLQVFIVFAFTLLPHYV